MSTEIHYEFAITVLEQLIPFDVVKFGKAIIILIGPGLTDLSVAIRTPYDRASLPTATKLLGNVGDTLSSGLAAKLAAKVNKPVYIACSVPTLDPSTGTQIEAALFEALRLHPEKF